MRTVPFKGDQYCGREVGLSYRRPVRSAHISGNMKSGGKDGYTKPPAYKTRKEQILRNTLYGLRSCYRHTYLQGCDVRVEIFEELGYPEGVVLPAPIVPHVDVKIDHPHLVQESHKKWGRIQ